MRSVEEEAMTKGSVTLEPGAGRELWPETWIMSLASTRFHTHSSGTNSSVRNFSRALIFRVFHVRKCIFKDYKSSYFRVKLERNKTESNLS